MLSLGALAAVYVALVVLVLSGAVVWTGPRAGNVPAILAWYGPYCQIHCDYKFFHWWHIKDIFDHLLVTAPMALLCTPAAL